MHPLPLVRSHRDPSVCRRAQAKWAGCQQRLAREEALTWSSFILLARETRTTGKETVLGRIRIGVAGLGRIGWKCHCREIAQSADFELAAVQDVVPERRQEAEHVYGVPSYETFGAMLRRGHLDAVTIATPSHLHARMAVAALRAGCHVLLEKPMARDAKEAEAIVRAAEEGERLVTVFQSLRALAYFQHLQRLLASGIIGQVYHVHLAGFRYVRRNDWQSLIRYGGGVLLNGGSHLIDQLLQLIGYNVTRIFCDRKVVASLGDAEDVLKIVVVTREGVTGEIDMNQAATVSSSGPQAWGTEGALELTPGGDAFTVTLLDKSDLPPKELDPSLASRDRLYPNDDIWVKRKTIGVDPDYLVDIYADFASAILRGTPLFVKPEEPLAVMRLIDACRRDSGRIRRISAKE